MTQRSIKILLEIIMVALYGGFAAGLVKIVWKRRNAASFEEWEKHNDKLKRHLRAIAFALISVLVLVVALWLDKHGNDVLKWMVRELGFPKVQYFVAVGVLVLGVIAYYFKRCRQREYGAVEIIFGIVASIIAIRHVEVEKFFLTMAALGASVYIVARGCSNLLEGEAAEKPDPELARFKASIDWSEKRALNPPRRKGGLAPR